MIQNNYPKPACEFLAKLIENKEVISVRDAEKLYKTAENEIEFERLSRLPTREPTEKEKREEKAFLIGEEDKNYQ